MVVEDPVEKRGLRKDQQETEEGVKDRERVTDRFEPFEDKPVQVIVFGVESRGYRVQKEVELQHEGIDKQYDNISGVLLPEDTDHLKKR